MAKHVLRDCVVTINSVTVTSYVASVTVESTRPVVDVTAMGATYMENILGIPDAKITMTLFNDYTLGTIDATLFPLSTSNTAFPVAVKVTSAAISTSNPEYQMSCLLPDYQPVAGDVGSANQTEVTFVNASSTGLVRDVTP